MSLFGANTAPTNPGG